MRRLAPVARVPLPSRIGRTLHVLRFAAFAPLAAGCLLLLYLAPSASSIAVLTATVQSVSFTVVAPDLARLPLGGYAISFEAGSLDLPFGAERVVRSRTSVKPVCAEGLLTPDPGTRVTYERFGSDPAAIELRRDDGRAVGAYESVRGSVPDGLRKASWVRLVAPKKSDDDGGKDAPTCAGTPATMLPIYGLAEIGSEVRPLSVGEKPSYGTLLDGTLDIFARAIRLPWLQTRQRIYPASTSSITIPAGSRVMIGGDEKTRRPWAGFAMPDTANSFGLDVRVNTEAREIEIVRPGGGLEPDVLSLGLFTQFTNDPILITAQVIAAFLFSIFTMLGSLVSWFEIRRTHAATQNIGRDEMYNIKDN